MRNMKRRETDKFSVEIQKLLTECIEKVEHASETKERFWQYKTGELKMDNSEARKEFYGIYGICQDFCEAANKKIKTFGEINNTDKRFLVYLLDQIDRKSKSFSAEALEDHIHSKPGEVHPDIPFLSTLTLNLGEEKLKRQKKAADIVLQVSKTKSQEIPGQTSLFDDKEISK